MHTARQKQTHRYRELTSGYQWGEVRRNGQDRGHGIKRYRLLCMK